jgi:large subunit ribosomal protein L25
VPGVVYGGGQDPLSFEVDSRDLRLALAHAGALLDLAIDGESPSPVVLKELIRHPVTGETTHIDLLRVRLDQTIQSTVVVELMGAEDSPGVKEGGVLEQVTREITIEALPTDIPDGMQYDVSEMQINDTITVESLQPPDGVTIVSEPETVLVMLSPPRLQVEEETEIEEETELVAAGETGEEAAERAEESSEESGGEGEE